jgi:hypothetical protein
MGLVWLLNGDCLVALTAKSAVIETKSGTRMTYRPALLSRQMTYPKGYTGLPPPFTLRRVQPPIGAILKGYV